jgi:hypothetical protein
MPGTIIFKPIGANLTHETSHIVEMDPYCLITAGDKIGKGEVCPKGGKHPHWKDFITLEAPQEPKCVVELFDKSVIFPDRSIGMFEMDLKEVESKGKLIKWYTLFYNNRPAGSVLMETTYQPGIHPHHLVTGDQVGMGISDMLKQADDLTNQTEKDLLNQKSIEMEKPNQPRVESPKLPQSEDPFRTTNQMMEEGDQPKVESPHPEDPFHSTHKDHGGLDLTSELGPHMSGYDENLGKPPENLKDVRIEEQTKLKKGMDKQDRQPPNI